MSLADIVRIRRRLLLALLLFSCTWTSAGADTLKISGTGSFQASLRALGKLYTRTHPGDRIEVLQTLGSGGGIKALQAGVLDLSISARPLTMEEQATHLKAQSLVRTPLVFVTSAAQAPTELDQSLLVELINGQLTHWPDNTPVLLILRPSEDSDTHTLIDFDPALAPLLEQARQSRGIPVTSTDQETLDLAEKRAGSFTTSTLLQVVSEQRKLALFSVRGVAPTLENMESGAYPLAKTLLLIQPPEPTPVAERFRRFLGSAQAISLMRSLGSLPLTSGGS